MSTKFRKAKSPAFNPGEVWYSACGFKVTIIKVEHFGEKSGDSRVHYMQSSGVPHNKDDWNFQVRYTHWSDLVK